MLEQMVMTIVVVTNVISVTLVSMVVMMVKRIVQLIVFDLVVAVSRDGDGVVTIRVFALAVFDMPLVSNLFLGCRMSIVVSILGVGLAMVLLRGRGGMLGNCSGFGLGSMSKSLGGVSGMDQVSRSVEGIMVSKRWLRGLEVKGNGFGLESMSVSFGGALSMHQMSGGVERLAVDVNKLRCL